MSTMVKFGSKMEPQVLEAMRKHADETGRTLASLLTEACADYLNRSRIRPHARASMQRILRRHHDVLAALAD